MGKAKTTAKPVEEKVEGEKGAMDTSVVLGSKDPAPETPATSEKPAKADKNSTTFVFKNGGTRTFSKDVHGAKWEELADEFAVTNAKILSSRDGKDL